MHPGADRNLVFGVLAVQMGLISRDALVAAMEVWALAKQRTLGAILVEAGALDPSDLADLESMIDRRIDRDGGDPARTLAALSSVEAVAVEIRRSIADLDILASVAALPVTRSESDEAFATRAGVEAEDPYATRVVAEDPYATRAEGLAAEATEFEGADPARTFDPYETRAGGSSERFAPGSTASAPTPVRPPGTRYRKVRKHAAGNLGVVYVARDEELNRDVALKEIKELNADQPYSQAKFLLEAEVTGGLEHPGIVPVYGLGHHDDGRPFYAMRFIRGKSLLDAIKKFHADESLKSDQGRRTLALQKLLRRFTDVCNAIAYAHSRGVLHRDLKPDNVMVGTYGETLVVDWGLAKTLGPAGHHDVSADQDDQCPEGSLQPSTSGDVEATRQGSIIGTPAYMSPEQARGDMDQLGPRSDVYSLGATLYCLLTGKSPFHGTDLSVVLQRLQVGDFPPPRAVDPSIDKALEAVCLKAMSTRPDDRYASCRTLAEDVDRWTADEPVTAWHEPWTVRLARWRRRHRALVTSVGLGMVAALLALSAGTALIDRERRRTEKEYVRAEREYRRARQAVDDYFVEVSENDLLNVPGMQPLRKELLGSARKYYRQFLLERADDPTLQADLAWTQSRLGAIALALNQRSEALESFRSTALMYEALAASEPKVWRHRLNQAIALDRLGMLLLDEVGRLDDAEKVLKQSEGLLETLAASQPDNSTIQSILAGSSGNLATVAESRGDRKTAATLIRHCVETRRKLLQEHPDDAELINDLAVAERNQGRSSLYDGRQEEANQGYEQAVKLYERLLEMLPKSVKRRHNLATSLEDLGRLYFEQGNPQAGRGPLERGLALDEALAKENPLVAEYRGSVAAGHNMMSDMERATGHNEEAGKHARTARDLLEALVLEAPDAVIYRVHLAKASNVLGRTAQAEGRLDEARQGFAHAVEVFQTLPDPSSVDLYNLACNEALGVPLVKPEARQDQVRRAMSAIQKAVASGFSSANYYRQDSDFDSLRNEPTFQQFLRDLGSR